MKPTGLSGPVLHPDYWYCRDESLSPGKYFAVL